MLREEGQLSRWASKELFVRLRAVLHGILSERLVVHQECGCEELRWVCGVREDVRVAADCGDTEGGEGGEVCVAP